MTAEKPAGNRAKDVLILLSVLVVAIGGIAAFGFYKDEITSYVRLQGWNITPLKAQTQQFVEAMAANDGERVASMLSPKSANLKPVREGGKVVALTVYRYGSTTPETLLQLAPVKNPEIGAPRLISLDGGVVSVPAVFPQGHTLDIRWDNTEQGWKVAGVSRIKAGE